jgi:hypothetical protein
MHEHEPGIAEEPTSSERPVLDTGFDITDRVFPFYVDEIPQDGRTVDELIDERSGQLHY